MITETKINVRAWVAALCLTALPMVAQAADVKTLEQVRTSLYGANLAAPSPESAVGQYLAETHAAWTVRKFPTAPVGNEVPPYALGAEKLVVAVGPDSFEAFRKYFTGANMMYQIYEPDDVRMVVAFEGGAGTEGQLKDQQHYTIAGTLMIPILLDSAEGDRARTFFQLASLDSRTAASPWRLTNRDGEPYSAMSSYLGCTHWFGGVPIGNNLVESYSFPKGDADPLGQAPNTKKLTDYDTGAMTEDKAKLVRSVWTVPGHEQLGMILKPDAFHRGEFTNAGWVAYTLLGSVGTDRTPVVFLMVDDERAPLTPDFALHISAQ